MIYTSLYASPVGCILLAANDNSLVGLWIDKQKYYYNLKDECIQNNNHPILVQTKEWLTRYFNKEKPKINELKLSLNGTDFQKKVWKILVGIPYGKTITYKDIAKQIIKETKVKNMSSQAIGNAVGHNPISIIIPCHRVVGTNGSLTGYAGGINIKKYLLKHENVEMSGLFLPKKGTAL